MSATPLPSPRIPLEAVLISAELDRRPARLPDYRAESEALAALMGTLREASAAVPQQVAQAALRLCRADSAGISIEELEHGRKVFRWHGAAGRWSPFLRRTIPREASPCGAALDRGTALLMAHPERHFAFPMTDIPPPVEVLLVPLESAGATVGTVWAVSHSDSRHFDREDLRLLKRLSEFAAVAYQLLERNAQMQDALERERAGSQFLQAISAGLIRENDTSALNEQILDAAKTIMRSDCASMQMLADDGGLDLLAWRGFHPDSARAWRHIRTHSTTSCGGSLRTGKRYCITDTERCDWLIGSSDLEEFRRSGIRAMQSTPLTSRTGELVGMLSTHWSAPHEPTASELRLFDVLARLAADLIERAKAIQALREADRRKNEFLAILSHELRNPLAPLTNGLELLQRCDSRPELIGGIHSMMRRQMSHLTRLVDDLLDLSRITRGTLEMRRAPLELRVVIETAIELARPLIEQRRHTLVIEHADSALPVEGDLERLTQAVSNVLGNAAKYTDPEGTIRLSVGNADDCAVIRIRDSGLGIPAGQLEQVFGMFTQVPEHHARSGGGGLGIGLALSRLLIELHGGSITASSRGLGLGSEFVLRVPLANAAGSELSVQPAAGVGGQRRRVLIVDDNVDAAETLRAALELMGHHVRTAVDGPAGLAQFAAFAPEVLLLDIGLPGMDGYDVARRVRAMRNGEATLLLAVTGWGQDSDRQRAREAGFDHHLTKPVTLEALGTLLHEKRPTTTPTATTIATARTTTPAAAAL